MHNSLKLKNILRGNIRGLYIPDYSETKLLNIVNSELADTLGNLASRCCGTALNPRGEYPPLLAEPLRKISLESSTNNLLTECSKLPGKQYWSEKSN